MKPTNDNILHYLEFREPEGNTDCAGWLSGVPERKLEQAWSMVLPDPEDVEAFLNIAMEKVEGLPPELQNFRQQITTHAGLARHDLANGDTKGAKLWLLKIQDNLRNLSHDREIVNQQAGRATGGKNGSRSSGAMRVLAEHLVHKSGAKTFEQAWATIPADHKAALTVETLARDFAFYRDGDKVVATDEETTVELGERTKSVFQRNYYRPALKAGT